MKVENKIKAVKEPKSYGSIHLNSKDFPEVKKLYLGDKMSMMIEVDIRSLRKPDKWEISQEGMKPDEVKAEFRIMGIKLPKKDMKKDMMPGGGKKGMSGGMSKGGTSHMG